MRNLVLCCDGTANQFAPDRTNVVKLYYAITRDAAHVTYYHPGVGTAPAAAALTPMSGRRQPRLWASLSATGSQAISANGSKADVDLTELDVCS